jgi:hypothetical protein
MFNPLHKRKAAGKKKNRALFIILKILNILVCFNDEKEKVV